MPAPEKVGVFGGGRMGAGIAHAFLLARTAVVVVEVDAAACQQATDRIVSSLEKAATKGALPESVDTLQERLVVTSDVAALADRDLVVEAVPESASLKASVLADVERVAPGAVLASNTSSLSIDGLADALSRPERLLGLHFFNPVPVSELVEIVVGPRTDRSLVEDAQSWVAALDKTAITVTDTPGFASSRLGVAIALEAMRMVEEGVASPEDIDTAMTLGYRHPMGPLRTTDVVGLDVRLAIAEHLAAEVDPRFKPPAVLREKVAAGELGRKSGRGFFAW